MQMKLQGCKTECDKGECLAHVGADFMSCPCVLSCLATLINLEGNGEFNQNVFGPISCAR